jgi:hypothetical protein
MVAHLSERRFQPRRPLDAVHHGGIVWIGRGLTIRRWTNVDTETMSGQVHRRVAPPGCDLIVLGHQ